MLKKKHRVNDVSLWKSKLFQNLMIKQHILYVTILELKTF